MNYHYVLLDDRFDMIVDVTIPAHVTSRPAELACEVLEEFKAQNPGSAVYFRVGNQGQVAEDHIPSIHVKRVS